MKSFGIFLGLVALVPVVLIFGFSGFAFWSGGGTDATANATGAFAAVLFGLPALMIALILGPIALFMVLAGRNSTPSPAIDAAQTTEPATRVIETPGPPRRREPLPWLLALAGYAAALLIAMPAFFITFVTWVTEDAGGLRNAAPYAVLAIVLFFVARALHKASLPRG